MANVKFISSVGTRYHKLIVLAVFREKDRTYANCLCDCGKTTIKVLSDLKRGSTKSCGCSWRLARFKHGGTKLGIPTPEYGVWKRMRARCKNPSHKDFPYYGGRGITVCARWNSFECFLADMGCRPSPKHSIDRFPNNNGNYELGNCRWATRKQQANNIRTNHRVTFHGETLTVSEWVEHLNLPWLGARLRNGWSIERAMTTPNRYCKPR